MRKLRFRVWYCKSLKDTGKPIMVQDMESNKITNHKRISLDNVDVKMAFHNSKGKAKSSGATTVLEVYEKW